LEAQLKAAQEENRKQFSQLALSGGSSPQSASASDPQADAQTDAQSEAYDNQLQQALQQFSSNDMAGAMRTCAALIQMDKKRWEAYALAGRALNAANQQAQAKGFFLKAEQLAPAETKPQIQQMIAQMGAPPPA
jgi:Tfp pilus assembly protein PilF